METINYSWDEKEAETDKLLEEKIEVATAKNENAQASSQESKENLKTRSHLQIMRRLFHMANGVGIATLYLISFDHSQMIHFLGTIACALYVVEQIRISYPETAAKLLPFTRFIMRAEEQLKESAMVPYAMAVLLTIVAFPKHIALVGIYTLAFADPLSAIIGIKFGKRKIVPNRTLEGSAAFFISTFFVCLFVLSGFAGEFGLMIFAISTLLAVFCTIFEMIPLKLDDNLTIPLFTSVTLWMICTLFGF